MDIGGRVAIAVRHGRVAGRPIGVTYRNRWVASHVTAVVGEKSLLP
jgi:hypothetical protein